MRLTGTRLTGLAFAAIVLVAAYSATVESRRPGVTQQRAAATDPVSGEILARAMANRERGVRVEGSGVVLRVLADDNDGARHQRFIVRVGSGQTLLIAHNIDVAGRVTNITAGDSVAFCGDYEWNPRGGVVHWTHHDPSGLHPAGWVRHNGRTYQ